jgi:hypothetical protein
VDDQKEASSEVKTHQEILNLFKDLESLEAKVKNPEVFEGKSIESEAFLHEIDLPMQNSEEAGEEPQSMEPPREIPQKKGEKKKQSLLEKKEKRGKQPEFATSTGLEQPVQEVKIPRSTFILELDSDGHLVGLPVKKPIMEKEKKDWFFFKRKTQSGAVEQQEEPVKGIKGKLKHVVSTLRRKKSSEAEPREGIGGTIKGLLKRKSKE